MFTVNGEYIVNHRIIENMEDTNKKSIKSGLQNLQNMFASLPPRQQPRHQPFSMTYKIDDTDTLKDVGGREEITDEMPIHELPHELPDIKLNTQVRQKLIYTINFDIKNISRSNIQFTIITNRHFNLINNDNNVYMIDISTSSNFSRYNINILNKSGIVLDYINFNIRINPNNVNYPYFVIRGLKSAIENTRPVYIKKSNVYKNWLDNSYVYKKTVQSGQPGQTGQ